MTAVCFGGVTTTSATVIGLGDVISRNDDWDGENTVTNTNWSLNSVWTSTPADGWQTQSVNAMTWDVDPTKDRFVRINTNSNNRIAPVIGGAHLSYTGAGNIGGDQNRWAFADWTSEQDGLVLKIHDTNNFLDFNGTAGVNTQAVVAYFDGATWTELHNTTGGMTRANETVTIAGGTFTLDDGDYLRIGFRLTANASSGWGQVVDNGLDFVVVMDNIAVPIPAAVWLFGSGLGLLGWMRKRQAVAA